jgi:hypothetical protein
MDINPSTLVNAAGILTLIGVVVGSKALISNYLMFRRLRPFTERLQAIEKAMDRQTGAPSSMTLSTTSVHFEEINASSLIHR